MMLLGVLSYFVFEQAFVFKSRFLMTLIENVFQILHWDIKMPAKCVAVLYRADCFNLWVLLPSFRSVDVNFLWTYEVKI